MYDYAARVSCIYHSFSLVSLRARFPNPTTRLFTVGDARFYLARQLLASYRQEKKKGLTALRALPVYA